MDLIPGIRRPKKKPSSSSSSGGGGGTGQTPLQRLGQGIKDLLTGRNTQGEVKRVQSAFQNARVSNVTQGIKPGQPGTGTAVPNTPKDLVGNVDDDGNVNTPDLGSVAQEALPAITEAEKAEVTRADEALADTSAQVTEREAVGQIEAEEGIASVDQAVSDVRGIADQGKADIAGLPDRVQADIQGIKDEYKQTTDVDIGKIESLGREAVGMAMDGKNAAAEAAVQAQQASTQAAIQQINADPNIPQSRKTAMIAQIRTQSSMGIAATVGANIATFTKMQTDAMTSTMQSVGSAMTARNTILGQLGGAEISAVSSAHETAATITKGYDDMASNAIQQGEQMRFNYNNLRETSRQMNNDVDMQILADDHYVGSMPTDFLTSDYDRMNQFLLQDFGIKLQASGYENMQEAVADGDSWAKSSMLTQGLMTVLDGTGFGWVSMIPQLLGALGGGK